jgi:Mn2+/Fe2+ NRAMP family transporter
MTVHDGVETLENGGAKPTRKKDSETDPLRPLEYHGEQLPSLGKGFSSSSWLNSLGPGLLVCLADTDAGCLIVAAQSGARWGYSLLLLQVVLIPVLFIAQELTIRLGAYTKKGHTACIRDHFGSGWAWFACILLVCECVAAMISEMSGVAAVGELWGLSRASATVVATLLIVGVVVSCNYRQIETIGITLGLFELTFVVSMVLMAPNLKDVAKGSFTYHEDPEFVKLISANIGAVIMPWMIYFQQSAVVARRMGTVREMAEERVHTLMGSFLTQLVMIGALVSMAAAHSATKTLQASDLQGVKDIVSALSPVLGLTTSKVLVSFGFVGGSLCAAFVVALAASWSICEALHLDHQATSLDEGPTQAPAFYSCFFVVVGVGAGVLMMGINVVKLNVAVELMDGVLLPFSIGFLFLLATSEVLPPGIRVVGAHKWIVGSIFALLIVCSMLSVTYATIMEEIWPNMHYAVP